MLIGNECECYVVLLGSHPVEVRVRRFEYGHVVSYCKKVIGFNFVLL